MPSIFYINVKNTWHRSGCDICTVAITIVSHNYHNFTSDVINDSLMKKFIHHTGRSYCLTLLT